MGNGHTSKLGREDGLIQRLVEGVPLPGLSEHISGITRGVPGLDKNISGHMHCGRIPQINKSISGNGRKGNSVKYAYICIYTYSFVNLGW